MSQQLFSWGLGVLCSALGLAACGGGGSAGDSVSADTAGQSATANAAKTASAESPSADNACAIDGARHTILQLVNQARASSRQCGDQTYPAVPALGWSCTLEAVAYGHAQDMGDHNFFNHQGSNGLRVGERVSNAGYSWSAVGENIAAGQAQAEVVVQGWLNSAGHCSNIMSATFTEMGMAAYEVTGSDYPIYWTQVLAKPR